jgi:hypothetical protein
MPPITEADEARFEALITAWREAATACASAEETYTKTHAAALVMSAAKNAEGRAAEAGSASEMERARRDVARIFEQAARWRVQWHLARAGRQGRWEP